jgi:hypothetical protein
LNTTPHILHTRTTIILPPSAQTKLIEQSHDNDKERQSRRARERAAKRLQTLTKEVDWRIAKAYVALVDDPDEAVEYESKYKEGSKVKIAGLGQASLEMMAVERYLDDDEWEEQERRGGRGVSIPRFPFVRKDEALKL